MYNEHVLAYRHYLLTTHIRFKRRAYALGASNGAQHHIERHIARATDKLAAEYQAARGLGV